MKTKQEILESIDRLLALANAGVSTLKILRKMVANSDPAEVEAALKEDE